MAQNKPPEDRQLDKLQEFKDNLEHAWKRTNYEGKDFYVRDHISRWMEAGQPKNAACLLDIVNQRIRRGHFSEIASSHLFAPDTPCVIVFAILISLDYGHLISIFHKHNVTDYTLHVKIAHQAMFNDLRHERADPAKVIKEFEDRKWAFSPVMLSYKMHPSLQGPNWILPFAKVKEVAEGGTAKVYQVLVQEDLLPLNFRETTRKASQELDSLKGYYEFAIKEYTQQYKADFEREYQAFMAISGQKGMVQYLGHFIYDRKNAQGTQETTYNILLEFGEFDLEEFFGEPQQYPPVLQLEIVKFWESFFKVADAISHVHNLTITTEGGRTKIYNGWHADIKPENILRVYGEFKLADFGFAKFSDFKETVQIPTSFIDGGTATYGAPETDITRIMRGTITPVSQTIDTWSFGCVLSITATWVVLGVQGILQYRQVRIDAINNIHIHQRPSSQDCFHNGNSVLPEVKQWHQLLRASMRKCDTITDKILDLIDDKMLLADPLGRIRISDLCQELAGLLEQAQRASNRPEISQDIMQTLLKFDMKAPSSESEANEATARQKSMDALVVEDSHERLRGKLIVPSEHIRGKSIRFSKEVQSVKQGKFAHRTSALASALKLAPASISKGKDRDNSITDHARLAHESWRSAPSPTPSSIYDDPYNSGPQSLGSVDQPLIKLTEYMGQTHQPISRVNSTGSNVQDAMSMMTRPETPPNKPQFFFAEPQELTPRLDSAAGYQTTPAYGLASPGPLHIQQPYQPRGWSGSETPRTPTVAPEVLITPPPTTPGTAPCPQWSPYRNLDDSAALSMPICKERMRLENKIKAKSFFRKPQKDDALKDLIKKRDIMFVVDRAPSMVSCWKWATFLVETLAMKLARLDDDGLDLIFSTGTEYDLRECTNAADFKSRMERAEPKPSSPPTDMSVCLGEIFRSYLQQRKYATKGLTLIVVTDGMWSVSASQDRGNAVEKKIVDFVNHLMNISTDVKSKVEDRWFSIQFISFATDPRAHANLKNFDSALWKHHGIPDVIDTKPWDHKRVENLILGSFRLSADDDSDDSDQERPGSAAGPSTPGDLQTRLTMPTSPSPSRSSSTRSKGKRLSLFRKSPS